MKTKTGFLTQAEIGYMNSIAEKFKELAKTDEFLQIDLDYYETLKDDLLGGEEDYAITKEK